MGTRTKTKWRWKRLRKKPPQPQDLNYKEAKKTDKKGQPIINIRFSQQRDYTSGTKFRVSRAQYDCGTCPSRSRCNEC